VQYKTVLLQFSIILFTCWFAILTRQVCNKGLLSITIYIITKEKTLDVNNGPFVKSKFELNLNVTLNKRPSVAWNHDETPSKFVRYHVSDSENVQGLTIKGMLTTRRIRYQKKSLQFRILILLNLFWNWSLLIFKKVDFFKVKKRKRRCCPI